MGQQEQFRAALAAAIEIEMYQEMSMTFWLPQTESVRAQAEGR